MFVFKSLSFIFKIFLNSLFNISLGTKVDIVQYSLVDLQYLIATIFINILGDIQPLAAAVVLQTPIQIDDGSLSDLLSLSLSANLSLFCASFFSSSLSL